MANVLGGNYILLIWVFRGFGGGWGVLFKFVHAWGAVEERFQRRLALWKRQYLSKGRRLTLLKNTLSSLLIYFMFLFVIPCKVSLNLEKIQRDF